MNVPIVATALIAAIFCAAWAGRRGRRRAPILGNKLLAAPAPTPRAAAETAVKGLLRIADRRATKTVCFAWDYIEEQRTAACCARTSPTTGTSPSRTSAATSLHDEAAGDHHDIFKGIINPEWHSEVPQAAQGRHRRQAGAHEQSIAIFGKPGSGKFEFVMTGRHMTIRCDGNSDRARRLRRADLLRPRRPAASTKSPTIPATSSGTRPWRPTRSTRCSTASSGSRPWSASCRTESSVGFRGTDGKFPGIPVTELSGDQKEQLQKVLTKLLEPYPHRATATKRCSACKTQGGLDTCRLAFYKDSDIGNDGVWDNWRLEGPSFVWYFRGTPARPRVGQRGGRSGREAERAGIEDRYGDEGFRPSLLAAAPSGLPTWRRPQ